jgi:hypothetical protein
MLFASYINTILAKFKDNIHNFVIKMTLIEFKNTFHLSEPPAGVSEIVQALWFDAQNNWEAAHNIAQSQEGVQIYDRLHAYLHRKEGDNWNANYWYKRAKTTMPTVGLEEEWENLVEYFLKIN